MEIASGIHQLQVVMPATMLGHLNCYLVKGSNGWLMLDTGWHSTESFESLQNGLNSIGVALTDIATIVVTHVHPDHFGLAGRIKHLSPHTELLMHRWEADLIESRYVKFSELQAKMSAMLRRHGVPESDILALQNASMPALQFVTMTFPDRFLYGGEIVSTGVYDLEIIWTPGHSPGHICLYEPQNQLLFAGDHILPGITPNVSYHVQSGDDPLGEYQSALNKLRHLPVKQVLPAHEKIFTDLPGRIDALFAHHRKREAEILKVLNVNSLSAYEVSSHVKWNTQKPWGELPPLVKRSAVMETISHLEHMRWEGALKKETNADHITYRLC
jgi:glyoxylase-like metal-dependent hydrolase (beta-lactamase superfamily II)